MVESDSPEEVRMHERVARPEVLVRMLLNPRRSETVRYPTQTFLMECSPSLTNAWLEPWLPFGQRQGRAFATERLHEDRAMRMYKACCY